MKKFGFTLAETLITLGIIGVIATVTLPVLKGGVSTAQIGPKLAKAVSTFEQANEALLNDNEADSLTDYGLTSTSGYYPDSNYSTDLSKFLKFTNLQDGRFLTKDGVQINFTEIITPTSASTTPAYRQKIGRVVIDINGASGPNSYGKDQFLFAWRNDGSLVPAGSTNWEGDSEDYKKGGKYHWTVGCPKAADMDEDTEMNYQYCAGHIFENNLKILYK